MPQFETEHSTIHYTDAGSGQAVLLIHGFPLSRDTMADVASELAGHIRVFNVDLPGFGASTTVGPFSMNSLARDCVEMLASHEITRFAVAGLSMGGYVALEMASQWRSVLSHLILIDTKATADDVAGRKGRDTFVKVAREKGTAAIVDLMYPKMMGPGSSGLEGRLRAVMNATPPLTVEYASCAMRDRRDLLTEMAGFGVPVQVIVGEHDAITPVSAAKQTASACGGRLDIIAGAGHLSAMEKPADVARVMLEFLLTK